MNVAAIICRITNVPELRETSSGKKVTDLRVAVNYRGKASFLNVEAWNKAAERAVAHGQGGQIAVSGRLEMNEWNDDAGTRHERVKIVASTLRTMNSGAVENDADSDSGDEPSEDPLGGIV